MISKSLTAWRSNETPDARWMAAMTAKGRTTAATDFCQLWLTCADKTEADKIANTLLVKHLVACVRQVPITSDYWSRGKINHDDEVLLMMESREDLFDEIQAEIAKVHGYDTFVLEAVPVSRISKRAASWLNAETKNV